MLATRVWPAHRMAAALPVSLAAQVSLLNSRDHPTPSPRLGP